MSLTTFVAEHDVKARLDAVVPVYGRTQRVPVVLPVRTAHPRIVGTAFDYALRLELERLGDVIEPGEWVAQSALRRLEWLAPLAGRLAGRRASRRLARDAARAREVVTNARRFHQRYQRLRRVRSSTRDQLAAHSLRLAKLDGFIRAGYLNTDVRRAPRRDIAEVVRLLEIAPARGFAEGQPLLLNPTFGFYSMLVGGADADIINGGRLIEIKTTKSATVERFMVRQLVGYMILARAARRRGRGLPRLTSLEIYFSRFGHVWTMPTREVIRHPAFRETERWFIKRAKHGPPASGLGARIDGFTPHGPALAS